MRFFIYQLLLFIVSPLLLTTTIYQAIKRKGGILYVVQRFSFFIPKTMPITTWFHCASLGEVKTALPLIEALLKQSPNEKILITTNTPTGRFILQNKISSQLIHIYMPWDFSLLVYFFLRKVRAKRLFILETEIWPALYKHCEKQCIPISIINGRVSQKTLKAPTFVKSLYRDSLLSCKKIICQSELNAKNFTDLIQADLPIEVLGNLKWYTPKPKFDTTQTIKHLTPRKHIALFSSHDDEEITVANASLAIEKNLLLVIIPRHPERRNSLSNSLKKAGYNIALRSKKEAISESTHIYIADTIGEIQELTYDAELCIAGGSFIEHGGQNFLEVAALGKAIICGPYMHNFLEISELFIQQHALIQCSKHELQTTIEHLLNNKEARDKLIVNALSSSQQNQSIVQAYLDFLNTQTVVNNVE